MHAFAREGARERHPHIHTRLGCRQRLRHPVLQRLRGDGPSLPRGAREGRVRRAAPALVGRHALHHRALRGGGEKARGFPIYARSAVPIQRRRPRLHQRSAGDEWAQFQPRLRGRAARRPLPRRSQRDVLCKCQRAAGSRAGSRVADDDFHAPAGKGDGSPWVGPPSCANIPWAKQAERATYRRGPATRPSFLDPR